MGHVDDKTERVSDPGDDTSKDSIAAELIRSLGAVASDLRSIAAPSGLEAATILGYGWWLRVVRSSDAIRVLHDSGYDHEASPLLRSVLHHAAALEWLRLTPEQVIEAVSYEHQVRRRKLYQKAMNRQWDVASMRIGPPPAAPRPASLELLERFERLADVVGAPNMYVAYMLESGYAHPSGIGSEVYVDDVDEKVVLLPSSKVPGVPLRQTAVFAGVASRSFGLLIDRSELVAVADEMGRKLGVSTTLA